MYNALNRSSIQTFSSTTKQPDSDGPEKQFLLLSTSLLVDRVLLYTGLVETLGSAGDVSIWASSFAEYDSSWKTVKAKVETFPHVRAFREIPYNDLRRFNEFIWDLRYLPPSRLSMMEHVPSRRVRGRHKLLKALAPLFAAMRTERIVEAGVEKLLLSYPRSSEAERRLKAHRPDVILSTGPFQFEQPGVFAAAKKLGIPTLAYVPSWDNITTKNRMLFDYDGYIVWNEQGREELLDFYPRARNRPVYVIGAPQFDIFYQERFYQSREEFCAGQSLDPNIPIVVYAIGSPNFLQESHGAVHFAKRVADGHLGNIQVLIRPHPIHDNAEMRELFTHLGPRVRLQQTPNAGKELNKRTQDEGQVVEWVNTFRHADVVVNLSSTVTIDAAIFDKPVVNLDFDPQPGARDQQLIKDINHLWKHFKPIAESGGVWLVNDLEEMETAVTTYLKTPELHREQRRWVVEHVCGFADGKCGERLANAIVDFSKRSVKAK